MMESIAMRLFVLLILGCLAAAPFMVSRKQKNPGPPRGIPKPRPRRSRQ